MSEKARELAVEVIFGRPICYENLTAEARKHQIDPAAKDIDAAVAPLVKASTNLRTEIVRFFGTDDAPADGLNNAIRALNEALEGWKQ